LTKACKSRAFPCNCAFTARMYYLSPKIENGEGKKWGLVCRCLVAGTKRFSATLLVLSHIYCMANRGPDDWLRLPEQPIRKFAVNNTFASHWYTIQTRTTRSYYLFGKQYHTRPYFSTSFKEHLKKYNFKCANILFFSELNNTTFIDNLRQKKLLVQ